MILACRGRPSVYVCTAIIDCQYRSCHPGAGDVVNLRDRNTLIYRSRCRTWRCGRFHSRHCRWFHGRHCRWFHSRHCRWFLGWLCRRFGGWRCRWFGGRRCRRFGSRCCRRFGSRLHGRRCCRFDSRLHGRRCRRFDSRHCRRFGSRCCRRFGSRLHGRRCRRFDGRRCRRFGGRCHRRLGSRLHGRRCRRFGSLHRFCHSRRGGLRCVRGIVRCRLCRLCSHPRICCLVWYTCRHRRRLHTLCRCCRWVRALHRCIRYHISRIRLFCLLRLIAVLRLRCRLSRLDCHRTFVGLFLILGGHDSLAGLFAGYDSLCIHCGDLFMFGFPDHLSPGTLQFQADLATHLNGDFFLVQSGFPGRL